MFSFVKYFDSIHNVTIPDPKDLPRTAGLITFQSSEFLDSLDNDTGEGTSLFFCIVSNFTAKREGDFLILKKTFRERLVLLYSIAELVLTQWTLFFNVFKIPF